MSDKAIDWREACPTADDEPQIFRLINLYADMEKNAPTSEVRSNCLQTVGLLLELARRRHAERLATNVR